MHRRASNDCMIDGSVVFSIMYDHITVSIYIELVQANQSNIQIRFYHKEPRPHTFLFNCSCSIRKRLFWCLVT